MLASPLTDRLTKQIPETLRLDHLVLSSFSTLRQALMGPLVLTSPDFTQPFIVQTDASGTSLRAVPSQKVLGAECPITFLSQKLHWAERK